MTSVEAVRGAGLPRLAKYEIREEIGRGGMATVYRALDTRLGREVAVKVLHRHLRDSAEVASRFHTEATAVAKLRHPNIVEVFDVSGPEEDERYLVVELVRGTTVRRLLSERGPMPPEIAAAFALELLDALAHAHASGVVHRDIKPENVLVELRARDESVAANDGARRVSVKLTDFGIAKLLDAHGVTSTGQVLGSPAHMAPEQIEGGEVDARSDLFGLGVLLYECLVGHLPFEGSNPAQVLRRVLEGRYPPAHAERPSVGSRWSGVVDGALAHVRDARFANAPAMRAAVAAELERLGFVPSVRELESWLEDSTRYAEDHRRRIVERLCSLGDEARRRRDSLSSASDYNRALANAPDDPGLLRIVVGIHRADARRRLAARIGIALAVTIAVAGGAHFLVRHRPSVVRAPSAVTVSPPEAAAVSSPPSASTAPPEARPHAPTGPAQAAPSLVVSTRPVRARPSPPVEPVNGPDTRLATRTLTFDLTPPMGVTVTVDEQAPRSISTGDGLVIDGAEHQLLFTCPVCTPVRRSVAAGDKSEMLAVALPVKPGTLVIDGAVGSTYQIVEHPELAVRAGANAIPLRSTFERITVKQIETGATAPVRLEAGKTVEASFPR
jgi:serine/threonine-protein kinase